MTCRPLLVVTVLTLNAAGCGTKVCEEAYSKMTACVQNLDCNKLGPLERDKCDRTRKSWVNLDETAYLVACGANQAEAEKIVACALDPRTCLCQGM